MRSTESLRRLESTVAALRCASEAVLNGAVLCCTDFWQLCRGCARVPRAVTAATGTVLRSTRPRARLFSAEAAEAAEAGAELLRAEAIQLTAGWPSAPAPSLPPVTAARAASEREHLVEASASVPSARGGLGRGRGALWLGCADAEALAPELAPLASPPARSVHAAAQSSSAAARLIRTLRARLPEARPQADQSSMSRPADKASGIQSEEAASIEARVTAATQRAPFRRRPWAEASAASPKASS
mmetsp:Transcript_8773/g.19270  ORF Transcript_8773/g.19270 Transcript_8773/m.19270 type:complete len:244 (+) Transcript_8773:1270-2001(+)